MRTLDTANFSNKKVLIRVDFNVPLDENNRVTDHTRIKAAKPTIDKVLAEGGSCVLMTHLGRPKGVDDKLSLRHIVSEIQKVLGVDVQFSKDTIGPGVEAKVQALQPGQVMLLENLRFYDEETKGDEQFANALSTLADCYINDAFGTAHRAHASTTIVAQFFPKAKYFGYLLAQEIDAIDRVMSTGEKPVLAVLGGAKVSSKITIIENILDKVDHLIIGGGMSFTFAKAMGGQIGNSICEDDKQELALSILSNAKEKGVQIHLPTDVVAGDQFSNEANQQIFPIDQIPDGWEGMDAGPESVAAFREVVLKSRTILWNGPLGVFEFSRFSQGTIALGEAISASTKNGAFSLVGGGDSVAAVKQFNMENEVSYVSTGGGAMLESLEGKTLPGIAAIMA
ncbi:MAG: phosphoglycerate kinase [Flavobacteriaceae bacterium]|jgi:phosphoglycerate kinase